MIRTEQYDENLIRTYSDAGFYIHGGFPEADYEEAIDPADAGRTYVETDIPIEPLDEATVEDYEQALQELGVV